METAIEFLIGDLFEKGLLKLNGDTLKSVGIAKEMFEKQFKYSFTKGMGFCEIYGAPEEENKQDEIAKQLYNATFKSVGKDKEIDPKQKRFSDEDMLLFAKFIYQDDGSFIDNDGNVKKDTLEQFKHYKQQEQ